jgi:superfamily II helicase
MKRTKKVIIVETATGFIQRELEPLTERLAEKTERGANINLNHEKYHTEIVDVVYCPICHKNALKHDEAMNAVSRYKDAYICNECAWNEAEADMMERLK